MNVKFNAKNESGFTLVELLVAIGIIVVIGLIAVVFIDPSKLFESARDAKRSSELRSVQQAIEKYISEDFLGLPRSLNSFNGYDNLISDSLIGVADCPNGSNGVDLNLVTDGYDVDEVDGANKLNVYPLIENGYIKALIKDPLDNTKYKACIDTINQNKLVIFSPNKESRSTEKYATIIIGGGNTASVTPTITPSTSSTSSPTSTPTPTDTPTATSTPTATPTSTPTPTPTPTTNFIANSSFETLDVFGKPSSWVAPGDQDGPFIVISAEGSVIRTGIRSMKVTNRAGAWAGPEQDIDINSLTNNQNYYTEVWMRMVGTSTPKGMMTMRLETSTGTSYVQLTSQVTLNNTTWTKVSGTRLVSWTGTLSRAVIYIETVTGTGAFYADDVIFQLP